MKKSNEAPEKQVVTIRAPNFQTAIFLVKGAAPLVVHRFSKKIKGEMKGKMETGKAASSKKNRDPKSTDDLFQKSRYVSGDGWDGFHAGAIRGALISACRLVGFKMTLAKLSLFVMPDGWDKHEPQIPLIRIYGEPQKQEDIARVETGQPYVAVRAAYYDWSAKIKIRWDKDQFTAADVSNLLMRAGLQVGICEGRPDSRKSCGQGWGLFDVVSESENKA